jgi:S1-C subfamily serine protease
LDGAGLWRTAGEFAAGGPLSPNPICASGQPGVSGLKSGDEITAIDGLPFRRVEDGLTIFSELNFADDVRLAVLRAGKKTEVTIPASVFEAMSGLKSTRLANGIFEVLF